MKRALMLMTSVFMALSTLAQVHLGVKGGVGVENVSFEGSLMDNLREDNHPSFFIGPILKFSGGVGADISLLYRRQNSVINSTEIHQRKLSIPVNIRYKLFFLPVYLTAGPQVDYNIGEKQYNVYGLLSKDFSLKDTVLSLNFGGSVVFSGCQLDVCYNIPCGNTGEFDKDKALSIGVEAAKGELKTCRWQASLALFF